MSPRDLAARTWLAELGVAPDAVEWETIAGGASPRRLHRVRALNVSGGARELFAGSPTAVVMDVPPDTPDVAFAAKLGRPWPFLEVRELLAGAGVRVPRVLARACERGLLLVEDLGRTLAEHLGARPAERERYYRAAVEDLARTQAALDPLPEHSIVRARAFDETLLGWEIEHFREWGLDARGVSLDAGEREVFSRARDFLVASIAALPRGFAHRDYQSRNLLVASDEPETHAPELGWIDFQDALLGPRAYDLVALLCDSYQPFDRAFVEARLDEYGAARRLSADERRALGREFDLVTVQRKLKDAGRFVFIERRRGDPSFLPYFEPTLAIVCQALERSSEIPELQALAALLDRRTGQGGSGPPA